MLESVARTGALVTAEEGTLTGGFGAEIAARVQEVAWSDLRAPVRRVARATGSSPRRGPSRTRCSRARTTSWRRSPRSRACASRLMLEIVLTREDANTEFALLAEWLVEDRAEVEQGQFVCVVETTKATVEIEAPGAGTIVQLYEEGVEVELGEVVARIAETAQELASLDAGREAPTPAPQPSEGERKATRRRSSWPSATGSTSQ